MTNDLLNRLAQAETDEERSWILTESLLTSLEPDLVRVVWAMAIPHWADAEILSALEPDLQPQIAELYLKLQELPIVEPFQGRGHNIHEKTRKQMLQHLWQNQSEMYQQLSVRAAVFFASGTTPELQIEWLYHRVIVDREWQGNELWSLAQSWTNAYRRAEIETLIETLLEQVEAGRVALPAEAEIYYWAGRARFRFYQATEALERYEQALAFYREIGARLGEANTLKAIGDVLQFLDRRTEALERYEQALAFYREIGDRLGEANTLQAIGLAEEDGVKGLEYCQTAFTLYQQIGDQYSQSRNLIYFTSVVQLKLRQQEAAIESLNRAAELAEGTQFEFFQETALAKIREIQGKTGFKGLFQRVKRWLTQRS
ncbi:MAG: tetratricopeptide repeat protein [Oculatellaceae cyanobacterium bins.114]|nr:tetratricopeptide repeat protein [Oculatellaceae cyanobacterium bins.114]